MKKTDLAENMARDIISSMPAKLEDATLQQSATAAGILIDKAQLDLTGDLHGCNLAELSLLSRMAR
jgi:hypothetical protein